MNTKLKLIIVAALGAFSPTLYLTVFPPGKAHADPVFEHPRLALPVADLDSPSLKPFTQKARELQQYRDTNRPKNFQRLDKLEEKISETEKQSHKNAQMAVRARIALSKQSTDSQVEPEDIAEVKPTKKSHNLWYRITHKSDCE